MAASKWIIPLLASGQSETDGLGLPERDCTGQTGLKSNDEMPVTRSACLSKAQRGVLLAYPLAGAFL